MERLWIERLKVREMGCLKDVDVALTPLHAFIGPNDSGKSTLLRAVEVALLHVPNTRSVKALGNEQNALSSRASLTVVLGEAMSYRVVRSPAQTDFEAKGPEGVRVSEWDVLRAVQESSPLYPMMQWLRGGTRLVRWDADRLRKSSQLIPAGQAVRFTDERGEGLPGIFDVIFNREDNPREEIRERIRSLFPTVRALQLKNVSETEKALEIVLTSGKVIPTETLSEGLLFYLAFLALEYLEPCAVLLVEEPENGLHPSRIRDVVKTLRKVSEHCQVLVATHSPLVVNELGPEEVTVVTRDAERGTITTPMKKSAHFEERSKIYALGELWLSYADGAGEVPLLEERGEP